MLHRRALIRFGLGLSLVYPLLMISWKAVAPGYRAFFLVSGEAAAAFLPRGWTVRFKPFEDPEDSTYVVIQLKILGKYHRTSDGRLVRDPPQYIGRKVNVRLFGYLSFAMIVSLMLATPRNFREKLRALFYGMLIVHFFTIFRTLLLIVGIWHRSTIGDESLAKFSWDSHFQFFCLHLVRDVEIAHAVPMLVWLLIGIPREQRAKFMESK